MTVVISFMLTIEQYSVGTNTPTVVGQYVDVLSVDWLTISLKSCVCPVRRMGPSG